jgi:hypothetical protein
MIDLHQHSSKPTLTLPQISSGTQTTRTKPKPPPTSPRTPRKFPRAFGSSSTVPHDFFKDKIRRIHQQHDISRHKLKEVKDSFGSRGSHFSRAASHLSVETTKSTKSPTPDGKNLKDSCARPTPGGNNLKDGRASSNTRRQESQGFSCLPATRSYSGYYDVIISPLTNE